MDVRVYGVYSIDLVRLTVCKPIFSQASHWGEGRYVHEEGNDLTASSMEDNDGSPAVVKTVSLDTLEKYEHGIRNILRILCV